MRLAIGLGNPGPNYAGTRHNVGWDAVERLARKLGWLSKSQNFPDVARAKFDSLALDGNVPGADEKLLLLEPLTFMNLSGKAVAAAMAFYQLTPLDILVVLDDMYLPCGKIRIRTGGSDGGHNGLKDIARALGTTEYPRLRLGVDQPPPRVPGKDYVLGRWSAEQRLAIEPALDRAADAMLCWMQRGIETAMNQFNAEPKAAP
jgi:peptidyl-tRNA hydrolase, PTH1 family